MRNRLFWAFFMVLATVWPAAALAQNNSTPGTLQLYSTFEAIGARLPYTGDANGDATARLEWRKVGDATWSQAHTMSKITNSRWAGSILWLEPNTSYEVRAVINDPDGGGTSASATTTTRLEPSTVPTGQTYWVDTHGNDGNDGSSGAPLATLSAAAAKARPGDQIRVRPGIYYQTFDTPVGGTATSPIHLVADGQGVILDGSDPALLHRTDWRSDGGTVYSIPYASSTRLVCADSLMRLYHQASLAALQSNANGISQGFAIEGGRLYVKLEGGADPNQHTMHVARYNLGMVVDSPWWEIRGFEIRHYGLVTGGGGMQIYTNNAWVVENHIHTLGGRGIFLRLGASDCLIERNLVRDPRVGTWPWQATKAHDEEITGISNRGGRGNVVRLNTVRGFFDGLSANDGQNDENVAADADFYANVVSDGGDDAIETDDVSGINLRVWSNTFTDNYSGVSIAPNYQGPEYVLFNVIANCQRSAFKFSYASSGQNWICHNTVRSSHSGSPAVWPSAQYSNMHFRNNIFVASGIATVNDDAGESQSGNDFNGDQLYVTGASSLFRWKGTNYSTLSTLRAGTGFEQFGRTGDPLFNNASAGDYRLQVGSPAIDGAIRMPGINDRYAGTAPDIGAFEYTPTGNDTTPPATINDLR
jgi:hypothetical protein